MTKEMYEFHLKDISEDISSLNKKKSEYRSQYIESNRPCKIGDDVTIITTGGRKVVGEAKSFSIGPDKEVYVDTVIPKGGNHIYISVPHKSLKVN